jgi:hypothetical protein
MKLVTFTRGAEERLGIVDDQDRIVDLHKAYGAYLREAESNPTGDLLAQAILGRDMIEFLKRGPTSLDAAKRALAHISTKQNNQSDAITLDRRQIHLKAPVPRPGALISAGKNFSDHVARCHQRKARRLPWRF